MPAPKPAAAKPTPVRPGDPVELRLARSAALLLVALSVPAIGLAFLAAGADGAKSAAIGAAVVIGMFLMAGAMLSGAAKIGPSASFAAALGGYVLRLGIYAGLIVLLRPVEWIHGPSLAITAAVLLVISLAWEVRLVGRNPSLFWVDPAAPRPVGSPVVYSGSLAASGATAGMDRPSHDPLAATSERTRP